MDDVMAARVQRLVSNPLFPFTGDLSVKPLGELLAHELVRDGESRDRPCHSCAGDDQPLWSNDRWKITPMRPSVNPVGMFLETVEHIDFEHFDDELAAEYGVLSRHLEAAIRALEAVGRVHIHRWGDGSAHFHVWFQGRPARQLELYGWGNVLWPQILPPIEQEVHEANQDAVIAAFVASLGRVGH